METLDRNMVRPQDVKIVLAVVAANPEGRLLAWRHLKAYWPMMHTLFGNATFMMGGLISAVTAHLSTPYDFYEVIRRDEVYNVFNALFAPGVDVFQWDERRLGDARFGTKFRDH